MRTTAKAKWLFKEFGNKWNICNDELKKSPHSATLRILSVTKAEIAAKVTFPIPPESAYRSCTATFRQLVHGEISYAKVAREIGWYVDHAKLRTLREVRARIVKLCDAHILTTHDSEGNVTNLTPYEACNIDVCHPSFEMDVDNFFVGLFPVKIRLEFFDGGGKHLWGTMDNVNFSKENIEAARKWVLWNHMGSIINLLTPYKKIAEDILHREGMLI